jgi:ABC-type sugar transport system substrate-binding protein
VYADNYSGGTQMGIFLSTKMKGEGKVIVLDTPGWHSLLIRARMAQATFEEFPGIEVLNTFEVGVDDPVGNAYKIVKSTLRQHPDLKGIITTWDMPTVGAIKAVKEMGKTKQIFISSADPGKPLLAEMAKPDAPVMMCMGQNARVLGQLAAEFMDRALTQGVDSVPLSVFGPTYFISNGDPKTDFSELTPMTPGECWDIYHYDTKRPF